MSKFLLISIFCVFILKGFSQNLTGSQADNYNGVKGVFSNPASIADNRYKWHANLFGFQLNMSNNQQTVNSKNVVSFFEDGVYSFFDAKDGKTVGINVGHTLLGPSFMLTINPKTSIAISSRLRGGIDILGFDGTFWNSFIDYEPDENTTYPFVLNSNNAQKFLANSMIDIGASVGRVLVDNNPHFLKAGITVKYLLGGANMFLFFDNIHINLNEDVDRKEGYYTNTTANFAIGSNDDFDIVGYPRFTINGTGIGGDVGLIYEYRPDATLQGRSKNKYKLKVGLSLLDIGAIRYNQSKFLFANYSVNIPKGRRWYPSDLDTIEQVSGRIAYLNSTGFFTNNEKSDNSYKVSLPTNLQFNIDYAIKENLFVELAGQFDLNKRLNRYSSFYYNQILLAPRFETRKLSIALPFSYNSLSKFDAGLSMRLGPVYFGSRSVFTFLLDKTRQLDAHIGISFGQKFSRGKWSDSQE